MRISDWSSDVCSSDLDDEVVALRFARDRLPHCRLQHRVVVGCPQRRSKVRRVVLAQAHVEGARAGQPHAVAALRSEEHTSELQSLMRISYAVFCLQKKITYTHHHPPITTQQTY